MKKFSEFLERIDEKYINWWTDNDTHNQKYDELWVELDRLLRISYAKIGGYMNGQYTKDDIVKDCLLIKIIVKNSKPVAFRAYKDKVGRKAVASACDGTEIGKKSLYSIWKEDLKYNRSWTEVSGAAEYKLLQMGGEMVPVGIAKILLGGKDIEPDEDGFHYTRLINLVPHKKVIVTGSSDELVKKIEKENLLS